MARDTEPTPDMGNEDFYFHLDAFKREALAEALKTSHNIDRLGINEITASRGESAQVIDLGDKYLAMVNEELGTKNLVADAMQEITGRSYYFGVGLDTAASEFNDLIAVGAQPIATQAHFIVGDQQWFDDNQRRSDLIQGFKRGCDLAKANWLGGETGILEGIVEPGKVALSGSAAGIIEPKEQLTLGDKLQHGDAIIYLPSSGVHTNALTEARNVEKSLPDGYSTMIRDGITYGEALLKPTPIYAEAVRSLFEAGVDIHYMSNITGHGWRKLMRADRELTYVMAFTAERIPPVFDFIQKQSGKTDRQMYAAFNMGMGFAVYLSRDDLGRTLGVLQDNGWPARLAGHVEDGPKRVVIKPKGIVFEEDDLSIR